MKRNLSLLTWVGMVRVLVVAVLVTFNILLASSIAVAGITNFTATQLADNRIQLDWSGFVDPVSGIDSYKLLRGTKLPNTCVGESITPLTAEDTTYIDTGVQGTTYYYRLCAVDSAGNMSAGATVSARAIPEVITGLFKIS